MRQSQRENYSCLILQIQIATECLGCQGRHMLAMPMPAIGELGNSLGLLLHTASARTINDRMLCALSRCNVEAAVTHQEGL